MEEIIVQRVLDKIQIICLENNKIVEFYELDSSNRFGKVGNVYLGIVKEIIAKNNSVFVDIGEEKNGYLQLDNPNLKYRIGEPIVVQIKKEATYNKGAKLTNKISLASSNLVLLSDCDVCTVSQKIKRDETVEKTIDELKEYISAKKCGFILRSSQKDVVSIDDLKIEADYLENRIKAIYNKQEEKIGLIFDANKVEEKILNDFCKKDTRKIYINDENIYEDFLRYKEELINCGINMSWLEKITFVFEKQKDFVLEFGMQTELSRVHDKKIWLKSSGYLVIEKTEALTSIDVNSGKFLGGNREVDFEDYVLKINEEAAIEVARQIRLKNIGGIIIVDFINMKMPENREKIAQIMALECQKDRSKVEVFGFTKLGLLEIARKML